MHHVAGTRRPGARHRGDQHRADARRSRVGAEAARAAGQGRQARRQGGGGRGRRAGEDRSRARCRASRRSPSKLTPEERALSAPFFLLTDKPTIFACNVKEADLATADTNPYVMKVREYVQTHLACEAVVISAQIESDLVDLAPDEADAFLKELGVAGKRHRRADPRHLSPARPADLFHGRREGSPRLDDSQRRHRAEGRRRDPLRFRARLHQGGDRRLRRSA